jgi:flavin reductase ActVB
VSPQFGILRPVVDAQAFKDVMASFASSVTVVTAGPVNDPSGLTVSAFTSVSLEPPLVLVCLDQAGFSTASVVGAGGFTVNILPEGKAQLALLFAERGAEKFGDVRIEPPRTHGAGPVLADEAMAILECTIDVTAEAGDHWILIGAVHHAEVLRPAEPLVYHRRRFVELGRQVEPPPEPPVDQPRA